MYQYSSRKLRAISLALVSGAMLLGAEAIMAGDAASTLATVSGSQDVQWEMTNTTAYSTVVLRVMGPDGFQFESKFSGDPELHGPLADGQYTYELYLVPTTKAATGSTKGASGGVDVNGRPIGSTRAPEGEYTKRGSVQSGTFAIQHGLLVDPNIQEG